MSADKHRGVQRRKFALAQLPFSVDGPRVVVRDFIPAPTPGKRGYSAHGIRPFRDVSQAVRELEKLGLVRRTRRRRGGLNPRVCLTILRAAGIPR